MGKKLTLAWMLVVALSIIVPLTGATMYAEDRPAVTAPQSVALESNVDAADVVLVYRVTLGSIIEPEAPSACSTSGSKVLQTVLGSCIRSYGLPSTESALFVNLKPDQSFATHTERDHLHSSSEGRVLLLLRYLTG